MKNKLPLLISYGAVISIPMILMSVLIWVIDVNQNKAIGWISILVYAITIYFAQKHFRDQQNDGLISYGKLYGNTILMILFTAIIMGIYSFIFYKLIAPEEITKMLDMVKISLYDQNLPEDQIKKAYEYNEKYIMTPISLSIMDVFSTVFQGALISLITSIFIKKKPDSFDEAMKEIENQE